MSSVLSPGTHVKGRDDDPLLCLIQETDPLQKSAFIGLKEHDPVAARRVLAEIFCRNRRTGSFTDRGILGKWKDGAGDQVDEKGKEQEEKKPSGMTGTPQGKMGQRDSPFYRKSGYTGVQLSIIPQNGLRVKFRLAVEGDVRYNKKDNGDRMPKVWLLPENDRNEEAYGRKGTSVSA